VQGAIVFLRRLAALCYLVKAREGGPRENEAARDQGRSCLSGWRGSSPGEPGALAERSAQNSGLRASGDGQRRL